MQSFGGQIAGIIAGRQPVFGGVAEPDFVYRHDIDSEHRDVV